MKNFSYFRFYFSLIFIFFVFSKGFAMDMDNKNVLILIDTNGGNTYRLAESMKYGIENSGLHAVIKRVPNKGNSNETLQIPEASVEELTKYSGIAFGSPIYFGSISTNMMEFMTQTLAIWKKQELSNIPATVFMSGCSGSGSETAIISFWNILASHGMTLVTLGNPILAGIDKKIPQGNTPYGITSRSCLHENNHPSQDDLKYAYFQGQKFANALNKMSGSQIIAPSLSDKNITTHMVDDKLQELGISLPITPKPVGNYVPYKIVGNMVYINQVALDNGKILYPGTIESNITQEQAKAATKQTMLNILSMLKVAAGGNLDNVKQAVQLSGTFNTMPNFKDHVLLMNEASNLLVDIFGNKGIHTRATFGANSLPLDSAVEIQAIFELK